MTTALTPRWRQDLSGALEASQRLVFYRAITSDPVFACWRNLLQALLNDTDPLPGYCALVHALTPYALQTTGDAWTFYLDRMLAGVDTELTRHLQETAGPLSPYLQTALDFELRQLSRLFAIDGRALHEITENLAGSPLPCPAGWGSADTSPRFLPWPREPRHNGMDLADHYRRHGSGQPCLFRVLRWEAETGLCGVPNPDPIALHDLVGYQRQKQAIIDNTRRLVEGHPAQNLLLYGPKGTGKSSMVKAVFNSFAGTSLRLLEIRHDQLPCLEEIVSQLAWRVQRFIIFLDDLSFEEYETEYRGLKVLLEGNVAQKPANVVFYATSNRRHLIHEYYDDRARGREELHEGDTQQEKLALSDRFGLSLFFPTPDQDLYLDMVRSMVGDAVSLTDEQMVSLALKWEKEHHGRSGRTARQFADYLLGMAGSRAQGSA